MKKKEVLFCFYFLYLSANQSKAIDQNKIYEFSFHTASQRSPCFLYNHKTYIVASLQTNPAMEWSKDKTMKLIEMLQMNASLWNPSLCDTRRDKQKRREELRNIAEYLEVSVADATKKIQHLRTQYNRVWAREARANAENPNDRYISNWYAYEYVHFLKDSSKPYRILQSDVSTDVTLNSQSDSNLSDSKVTNLTPPYKITRTDSIHTVKPDLSRTRDDFSVFGEYVANELRSLKGEKNQLIAKKKILDIIFEVKMGTCERQEQICTVFSHSPRHITGHIHSDKVFTTPLTTAQIEPPTPTNHPFNTDYGNE